MLRYISLITIFCVALGFSASSSFRVGGSIPVIQSVNCIPNANINFTEGAKDITFATCTINNNTENYEVTFKFDFLFGEKKSCGPFTSLKLKEVSGTRGEGISNPTGTSVLPSLQQGQFIWKPETQTTSTIDYVVEIKASWVKPQRTAVQHELVMTNVLVAEL